MPIPLPNLDDRAYADLVAEGRDLIPNYAPEWTNHNPSDPGITLVEMFAYLYEMLLYRVNRVTDENRLAFLRLLKGPDSQPTQPLNDAIRDAVLTLRRPNRAVTCGDFELLAQHADASVKRARCVPRRNLELGGPEAADVDKPGHVSVVIVPDPAASVNLPDTLKNVAQDLETRRLLTTHVHVVGPRYLDLRVRLTLHLRRDALKGAVADQAVKCLQDFFDPLCGGIDKQGWPFGRPVYVSEIYQLLDTLDGVDYVTPTYSSPTGSGRATPLDELVVGDATRLRRNDVPKKDDTGQPLAEFQLVAVELKPDELVRYVNPKDPANAAFQADLTIISPVGQIS